MPESFAAPPIEGLLESSLYARDLQRTAAFYRDILGLKALVETPRLVAFEIAARSVLLVFQAGATEADVVEARGVIPGHDGRGRLHFALSIAAADLEGWRAGSPRKASPSLANIAGRVAASVFIFTIPTARWSNWRRRAYGGERRANRGGPSALPFISRSIMARERSLSVGDFGWRGRTLAEPEFNEPEILAGLIDRRPGVVDADPGCDGMR